MELIWWILPALAGVIGLMLAFGGLGRLFRLKPFSGLLRLVFGVGFLGLAGVVTFAGLNLQTYKRLTYERPVAVIKFAAIPEAPETFRATIQIPEEPAARVYDVKGDEFQIGARVITFKPMAQMLGYDSVYRLDFFEGRFEKRYNTRGVTTAESTGVALSENPGFDVAQLAKDQGASYGIATYDASFGSAVYNPMADGLAYEIWMTQNGLKARGANAATQRALGEQGEAGTSQVRPD